MSENKDLEEIKQQLQVGIDGMDWDGEFDDSAYKKIIEAASRMAAENKQYKEIAERLAASGNNSGMALIEFKTEIERLKEENTSYTIGYTEKCAEIEDLNESNARLKAELAKQPEVVRCGECKKKDTSECPQTGFKVIDESDGDCCFLTMCGDNDYCSAGERRESEGE